MFWNVQHCQTLFDTNIFLAKYREKRFSHFLFCLIQRWWFAHHLKLPINAFKYFPNIDLNIWFLLFCLNIFLPNIDIDIWLFPHFSAAGALVTFSCRGGAALRGSPSIHCDGQNWNDSLPICFGMSKDKCKYKEITNTGKLEGMSCSQMMSWSLNMKCINNQFLD